MFFLSILVITSLGLIAADSDDIECRAYEKCLNYLPKPHYKCKEIAGAWQDIYKCLELKKSECSNRLWGAGIIIGHCSALYDYYQKIHKCGLTEYPDFPSKRELCGMAIIPDFKPLFRNDSLMKSCGKMYYPQGCHDEERMKHYTSCIMHAAGNPFTKGFMNGACRYFFHDGKRCNFDKETCAGGFMNKPVMALSMFTMIFTLWWLA